MLLKNYLNSIFQDTEEKLNNIFILKVIKMTGRFKSQLKEINESFINFDRLSTLQINVGDLCNQTCTHCHVTAGPNGKKIMSKKIFDKIIEYIKENPAITVDITGGAPEMNPHFKYFVGSILPYVSRIMVRTNLTIIFEKGYEWLPDWYGKNKIVLVASLPCYTEDNVNRQRGKGVFNKSIEALKILNKKGYGRSIELNIVYNPGGAFLPGDQTSLEEDYRHKLFSQFGILFNYLFTITNAPIGRFEEQLKRSGEHSKYMKLLMDNFNPNTAESIMCRSTISVNHEGTLFNCDFNQMKNMPILKRSKVPLTISDIQKASEKGYPIVMADHCYVCTAGAGSCCTGALDAG